MKEKTTMISIAAAIEALFNDPNVARPAVNRAGVTGMGTAVRDFARWLDQVLISGAARVQPETTILDGPVAQLEDPGPGDTVEIDGTVSMVQGEPVRDSNRLI